MSKYVSHVSEHSDHEGKGYSNNYYCMYLKKYYVLSH